MKSPRLKPARPLRILDFDIETRRVGFLPPTRFSLEGIEPIVVACSWADEKQVQVWCLGEDMLGEFRLMYEEADMVTGHYCRKFDLPALNGAMMEHELPPLPPRLVSDTKCDLLKRAGLSMSQENLGAMYRLAESKFHMNDTRWRAASRLGEDGMKLAKKRAADDVRQHKALRLRLAAEGWLGPPRVWSP